MENIEKLLDAFADAAADLASAVEKYKGLASWEIKINVEGDITINMEKGITVTFDKDYKEKN